MRTFTPRPQVLINLPSNVDSFFFFNLYGVVSLLIPAIIGMSVILMALRRWTLPLGALLIHQRGPCDLAAASFVSGIVPALMVIPLGGISRLLAVAFQTINGTTCRSARIRSVFVYDLLSLSVSTQHFGSGLWCKFICGWAYHFWQGIAGLFLSFPKLHRYSDSKLSK